MARLTPRFSANRTVREYAEQHYLPAADEYRRRSADNGAVGKHVVEWRRGLEAEWDKLHFNDVTVETKSAQHIFQVRVALAALDGNSVRVELYANGVGAGLPVRQEMTRVGGAAGDSGGIYTATVPAARPAGDYTARIVPHREGVAIPLEDARVLWQR